MFEIDKDKCGYYIKFYKQKCCYITDIEIARQLTISLQEYINILLKFNAIEIKPAICYFKKEQDCEACSDYLKDMFETLFQLIGE